MGNMAYCKVTAIIRSDALDKVERRLQEVGAPGISVTQVKGYGEYADHYSHDMLTTHTQIEIITAAKHAEAFAQAIMDGAHSGVAGDGIVAVMPVSKVYRIRHRAEVRPDDLQEPLNR